MKKLIVLGILFLSLLGCEKKIPVFGDRTVIPNFEIYAVSDTIGTDYSNYVSSYTVKDTSFVTVPHAKLITYPLFKYSRRENLVSIYARSNARWKSTPPFDSNDAGRWFMNTTLSSVGDSRIDHYIPVRNANSNRKVIQVYYVTQDSSIVLKFNILQMGKTEDPN